MKIFKKIATWILTIAYLLLIAGFVGNRYENQLCNGIRITIQDSLSSGFLSQEDVLNILEKKNIHFLGEPLSTIDLTNLEKGILDNQIVKDCRAYTGTNGLLYIDLNQREPFVRIIDRKGDGYYIDVEGNILELSKRFTPHVLVVNGDINTPFRIGEAVNVNNLGNSNSEQIIKDIYELTRYINQDELWNSQFVQIYVTKSGEFELVPRVGPHLILLGEIEDYKEKLSKLEIFYKEGLNTMGGNQYLKINLKYKDQVVCTKI
jgi:cell division protein FtsQ